MELKLINQKKYTVLKFSPEYQLPTEFYTIRDFKSLTCTDEECSVVVPEGRLPTDEAIAVDKDWTIIKIVGELDFSLIGILTQLANPLAANGISIFALSTYNTDYLLIKAGLAAKAVAVLQEAGHTFID